VSGSHDPTNTNESPADKKRVHKSRLWRRKARIRLHGTLLAGRHDISELAFITLIRRLEDAEDRIGRVKGAKDGKKYRSNIRAQGKPPRLANLGGNLTWATQVC